MAYQYQIPCVRQQNFYKRRSFLDRLDTASCDQVSARQYSSLVVEKGCGSNFESRISADVDFSYRWIHGKYPFIQVSEVGGERICTTIKVSPK